MLFNACNAHNTRKGIKGIDTNNFNVEKSALKVCRISAKFTKNGTQNLQVTREEFSVFLPQNSNYPRSLHKVELYITMFTFYHMLSRMRFPVVLAFDADLKL